MESEFGNSRIRLYAPSPAAATQLSHAAGGGVPYLKSFPGIIRVLSVIFSGISLILVLVGFSDDFPYYDNDNNDYRANERTNFYRTNEGANFYRPDIWERKRQPWLRLSWDGRYESIDGYYYYGAGYANERPNVAQLVCILVCLLFSAFLLFLLVISPECHQGSKRRGWNRFLNLSLAVIQLIGFLNGIAGLMLFRSYCCHVEFSSNERHKIEREGYFREPCLCYVTPSYHFRQKVTAGDDDYSTMFFNDTPDDIIIHSALPHHFIPRAICLCLMGINTAFLLVASFKI